MWPPFESLAKLWRPNFGSAVVHSDELIWSITMSWRMSFGAKVVGDKDVGAAEEEVVGWPMMMNCGHVVRRRRIKLRKLCATTANKLSPSLNIRGHQKFKIIFLWQIYLITILGQATRNYGQLLCHRLIFEIKYAQESSTSPSSPKPPSWFFAFFIWHFPSWASIWTTTQIDTYQN